jgi:prephenate dehydrogenase
MTGQIAIIGLGQIGASVGMALKRNKSALQRLGFDKNTAVSSAALTVDVVDQVPRRLADTVRDADIILLCLPLGEVPLVLKQIASLLKPNAVVMDTGPLKGSTVKLMQDLLPAERFYVGLVPAVSAEALTDPETGFKGARPDLFKRTVMIVDVPRGAPAEVEQLAVNLVKLLGAKPMLADLAESDGMMTITHILPQLTAAALLGATVDQPGWADGRKLAGRPFVSVTGGMAYYDDPASLRAAALANQTGMVHALDVLMASLQGLRDDIAHGDQESLGERLQMAFESRERWLDERGAADWLSEGGEAPELPEVGEQLMQMFFGSRLADRMKKSKEKGKKN